MFTRRTRGYLPHIETPNGTYFLTFRLHDSLPTELLWQWTQEVQHQKRLVQNQQEKRLLEREYHRKIEAYLDNNSGCCWLKDPTIASIVSNALRHFNGQRYRLHVWTIMPNHVHVLFDEMKPFRLESIAHTWKSFTAHEANRILNRTGPFWQRESYDAVIRSARQFDFTARYILNNPVKAGFCKEVFDWQWTGCSADVHERMKRFY